MFLENDKMIRKALSEAIWVLLVAVLLAAASYGFRPGLLPLVPPGPAASEESDQLYKEISFEQAREMFADRQALFADARPSVAYEEGHIQGAVHLDPTVFEQWADMLMSSYGSDQPIITYCEGAQCTLSKELAEKLTWLGFQKVYFVVDGWGQWTKHRLPVD
jgi:rhodanese-related sulfurtransferase